MSSGIDWGCTCQICFDLDRDDDVDLDGYPGIKESKIENLYMDENGGRWDICWECHDNEQMIYLPCKYFLGATAGDGMRLWRDLGARLLR